MSCTPVPQVTTESAAARARLAVDAWNAPEPARETTAYPPDSRWRNGSEFLQRRTAIEALLARKWSRELGCRLIKKISGVSLNCISLRFAHEWHDVDGRWFRSYGTENREFDDLGLMRVRIPSNNDAPITARERRYFWPPGPRPADRPSLRGLGY